MLKKTEQEIEQIIRDKGYNYETAEMLRELNKNIEFREKCKKLFGCGVEHISTEQPNYNKYPLGHKDMLWF